MTSITSSTPIHPRIILHGGAGAIDSDNLPPKAYNAYKSSMLSILHDSHEKLQHPGAKALDVATYAVTQLEDNGLFNAGHGAVFTTAGTHELEASVMVSRGYRKRGVGVMKVTKAKNPIKLAREMLIRGEEENGGGAGGHCQLEGETCDHLVKEWGLETVRPSYFWTRRRWDEHRRGLNQSHDDETYERDRRKADEGVDGAEKDAGAGVVEIADGVRGVMIDEAEDWEVLEFDDYLPQGTVGAVVLDSTGTICTATSTGGLTNKLPGRIGDTPTLGAGFWAEEWTAPHALPIETKYGTITSPTSIPAMIHDSIPGLITLPNQPTYVPLPTHKLGLPPAWVVHKRRAVGMSGTGNGDSFLKLSAVRTAAAIARFDRGGPVPDGLMIGKAKEFTSLQEAVAQVAGLGGMLQQSAEDRWQWTGEGQGGIIGIELRDGKGEIVFDFNCGGMFHAWVDDGGVERFSVFNDELAIEKQERQ